MNVFTYRKRAFLNPISTGQTSFIVAEVESSDDGTYKLGTNLITIADCKRIIRLEFFLGNKRERRISLAKIDLIISILTSFRNALAKEIQLIEKGG